MTATVKQQADTALWTITRDGRFVATGSSPTYPEAWAAAMSNLTRFLAWDTDVTDDEWDTAEAWGTYVNPTVRDIGPFTITTGPIEPTIEQARVETPTACEGFQWLGQSWEYCERCNRPDREHAGIERPAPGAGPFSDEVVIVPWAEFVHKSVDS